MPTGSSAGEIALDEFGGMVEELGLKVEGKNSPAELLDRFVTRTQTATLTLIFALTTILASTTIATLTLCL